METGHALLTNQFLASFVEGHPVIISSIKLLYILSTGFRGEDF